VLTQKVSLKSYNAQRKLLLSVG